MVVAQAGELQRGDAQQPDGQHHQGDEHFDQCEALGAAQCVVLVHGDSYDGQSSGSLVMAPVAITATRRLCWPVQPSQEISMVLATPVMPVGRYCTKGESAW